MDAVATPDQIVISPQPTNIVELTRRRNELLETELPVEIASAQEYAAVAEYQGLLQREMKTLAAPFEEGRTGAYKAWKLLCGIGDLFLKPLADRNERARSLLSGYQDRLERIRREEERRLRDEEQRRLEDERKQQAKLLEKQGQKDLAAAVRATPVSAPVITLPSEVPKVDGLSYRDEWDMVPLLGDTPDGWAKAMALLVPPQFLQFVSPNRTGMRAFARQTKGSVRVPGFEFTCSKVPVRR